MDSIATARDFFINQQGLSPDQADMIVSQGLQAYNQQTQPQSMMQMASGGRIGYGIGSLVKGSGVAEPVSEGGTSSSGFGGMGLMGRLIQQNPQMFRRVETSRADFIDVNQNGIDDRQEAAYGGRIGYQLGGISTMPMDYGQPLQVPQQQQPMFTTTGSATSSPLLNYGQTRLNQAGGTSLSRTGYQEGGLTEFYKAEEPIIPRIENIGGLLDQAEKSIGEPANNMTSPLATTFSRFGYEAGGVTLPSQGSELSQMEGMDQQQALQTIIQILIENGIPPEQAQELALQIIQIFAQGGAPAVEAFADQLEQEELQAMAGGGIAGYAQRQGYFVGSVVKGITGAVKGVVKGVAKAVKSVAKSTIGRAALTIAAATFLGPGAFGIQGLGLSGLQLGLATAGANLGLQALGGQKLNLLEAGLSGFGAGLSNPTVPASSAANITVPGVEVATAPTSYFSPMESQFAGPSQFTSPVPTAQPLTNYYSPTETMTAANVNLQQPNPLDKGIMAARQLTSDPLGTIKNLATSAYDYAKENPLTTAIGLSSLSTLIPRNEGEDDDSYAKRLQEVQGYVTNYGRNLQIKNPYFYQREGAVNPFPPNVVAMAANGGIMGYAKGGSMVPPARQIEGGIIELDARKTGGYIPYGKKERVDDVPAMLAKDEFVFTSRAVKAAGGGSARRGAAKMYKLMKQLESKGMKMERGARA